jgi:hypothetical protein
MANPCKSTVLAAIFLLLAGAGLPLWSQTQTWQQKYCSVPVNTKCELPAKCPSAILQVHIHSVSIGSKEYVVDGDVHPDAKVDVGQPVVLNGCNFGSSGTIGVIDAAGKLTSLSASSVPTAQPWTDNSITLTVTPAMAIQAKGTTTPMVYTGRIGVETEIGNSNTAPLSVVCSQPEITSVSPASTAPNGAVAIAGCGFGPTSGAVTLQSTETNISTQSGYAPETFPVQSTWSWGDKGLSFRVPASTPAGSYTIAVNGTSGNYNIIVSPAASTSPGTQPPSTVGAYDPQTLKFTPRSADSTPFYDVISPDITASYGISPVSPNVWAAFNTQTAIPVQVENIQNQVINDPSKFIKLAVQLQIWQHTPIVQCDPNGPMHGSPDGNAGQWVQLGTPQPVALGTQKTNLPYPVSLNPGVNYVALGANGVPPQSASGFQCPANGGPYSNSNASPSAYPNSMIGKLVQEIYVLPVSTAVLDAVPYTIIYEPPGDQSTSNVSYSVTNSTQYKVTAQTKTSNSKSDAVNTCYSAGITIQGVGPTYQDCTTLTNASESDFAGQWIGGTLYSNMSGVGWPIGKVTTLVPSPDPGWLGDFKSWGDTYANEPFWYDEFVFLLNPTYAVYNSGGTATFLLLPQNNLQMNAPPIPVAYLAACAAGLPAPTGPGFPAASNPCDLGNNVILTPQEALSALHLDPFYPGGQGIDPTGGCTGPSCRIQPATFATPIPCCVPEDSTIPSEINTNLTTQTSSEVDSTSTYIATVTNVHGTTGAINAKLDGIPLSITPSAGVSQASTLTQNSSVTISYETSTILTSQQSTAVQIQLSDVDNAFGTCSKCHAPLVPVAPTGFSVSVYEDSFFGTLLFRDPGAPGEPVILRRRPGAVVEK